jgi:hypothetical protein
MVNTVTVSTITVWCCKPTKSLRGQITGTGDSFKFKEPHSKWRKAVNQRTMWGLIYFCVTKYLEMKISRHSLFRTSSRLYTVQDAILLLPHHMCVKIILVLHILAIPTHWNWNTTAWGCCPMEILFPTPAIANLINVFQPKIIWYQQIEISYPNAWYV